MNSRRIILLSFVMLLLSFAYFAFLRDGFTDSIMLCSNLSDSFSVVGVIVFLPALGAYFDAYKVFHGFKYAMKTFLSQNFKDKYSGFKDYLEDQNSEINSTVVEEFLIVSFVWILIAIIIALVCGG